MCYKMILLKDRGFVPCGKCAECRKAHFNGWYQRLKKEAESSYSAFFVTLTYETEPDGGTLDKTDLQKYFKRLRKYYPSEYGIKYYAVGEYGGKTERPHYHAIIFNAERKHIRLAWELDKKPIGLIHIGQVNDQSIQYTLGYIKKNHLWNKEDARQKPFAIMSKRLGSSYLTPQMVDWHRKSPANRNFYPLNQTKIPLCRYYKDRIFDDQMKEEIKENRNNKVLQESVKQQLTTSIKNSIDTMKQNTLIRIEKDRKHNEKIKRNKI